MKALLLLVLLASIPRAAFAQAAIAGSVMDPSDAPIRGVLVEARSPALIEKARTALTDSNGQYRIEDLRPGIYKVSFTLVGWRPYQQDGVELRGSLTTSVNVKLLLGSLTDSITVTGKVPVVDVHSAKHEVSLTGEVVRSIPTVRSYNALLVLVPGVVSNVDDTVTGTATTSFRIHGGRTNEGRLSLDGLHGVTAATPLTKVYDVSGVIGGPIKDCIWHFANAHVGRVCPRSPATRRDWGSIDLLIGPEWTCGRNYSMRRPVASVSYHGAP